LPGYDKGESVDKAFLCHLADTQTKMNRLSSFRLVCLLFLLLIFLGFGALSMATTAAAASRDEQTNACRIDALRFCLIDIPSESRITACMKKHMERLSPECKAMFDQDKPPESPTVVPSPADAAR
jgi:hypothetical protein